MIIMINGAFGSGKTSAASMLQPLIPNSMIFDPEEIGFMLRKIVIGDIRLEEERTDDFQDLELWKVLTVKVAQELKNKYNKHLIIPMTIYKTDNFEYIYNGLREVDKDIFHFCLIASEKTIHKRLSNRGDTPNGWTFQKSKKCIDAFKHSRFQEYIVTDEIGTKEVVESIQLSAGISK
jgi:hypothetical protein